jgi:hypothetical protein
VATLTREHVAEELALLDHIVQRDVPDAVELLKEYALALVQIDGTPRRVSSMNEFPTIVHMLRTIYNAADGLSEEVSMRLYQRAASAGDNRKKLQVEMQVACSRPDFSWRHLLFNDDYEVADFETEAEAHEYARKILWEPLFGKE